MVELAGLERREIANGDRVEIGLLELHRPTTEFPVQSGLLPGEIDPEPLADAEDLFVATSASELMTCMRRG